MQLRSIPSKGNSGFVLLQVLWVLLLASLLASIAMSLSLDNAKDGAATGAVMQADITAESGVNNVLFDMLAQGRRSVWLKTSPAIASIEIDGEQVSISVQDISGLVDLNSADDSTVMRLVLSLPIADPSSVINAIKAARPITSYAQLAAVTGMTPHVMESLSPHITLFSGRDVPSSEYASSWLTSALRLAPGNVDLSGEIQSVAGRTMRVTASTHNKKVSSRMLNAEVVMTGRRDQPILVYDWSWHANIDK